MPRWSIAAAALLAVSLSMGLERSAAEPLPKEECDKLKAEQADLTAAGVRDQLGRGADWGKVNLNADQMRRVDRYIVLEEQLSFRCGLAKLRASLPVAEEGGEQELDENGQPIPPKKKDGAGEANVKPKAKAPAKAASRPQAGAETSPAPRPRPKAAKAPSDGKAQAQSQPTAAKPRPKPKAKVDDAYRPATPQDPGADPFAGQVPAARPKQ